jgi:hypothetical protein
VVEPTGQLVEATLNTAARVVAHKDLLEVLPFMLAEVEAVVPVHQVEPVRLEAHGGRMLVVMLLLLVEVLLVQMGLKAGLEPLVHRESLAQAMAAVVEDFPQEAILAE